MIGDRIRELRKEKGLTQEELAKIIGVERSSIGKYESKKQVVPSDDVKRKLAEFFNVSLDYLCGMSSQKNAPAQDSGRGNLVDEVTDKILKLRPEKQSEVLSYVEYLLQTDKQE